MFDYKLLKLLEGGVCAYLRGGGAYLRGGRLNRENTVMVFFTLSKYSILTLTKMADVQFARMLCGRKWF